MLKIGRRALEKRVGEQARIITSVEDEKITYQGKITFSGETFYIITKNSSVIRINEGDEIWLRINGPQVIRFYRFSDEKIKSLAE